MLDLKLKIIEEKAYEAVVKVLEECEVPLMFAGSVLKNIECKIQEKVIQELSFRLLKEEQEKQKEKEEEVKND